MRRQGLLSALCRLQLTEGNWKGGSWGTRPDTRGPYFQPEAWEGTVRIAEALDAVLSQATPAEAAFLAGEMGRHRIDSAKALDTLLALASRDPALAPVVVKQLARADAAPPAATGLLRQLALADATPAALRADVIEALIKSSLDAAGVGTVLQALGQLSAQPGATAERHRAGEAFLNSTTIQKQPTALIAEAEKISGERSRWADAALLRTADRLKDRPKASSVINEALASGWSQPRRRVQLMQASVLAQKRFLGGKILAALHDPDPVVAATARETATALKLDASSAPERLLGTLKTEEAVVAALGARGDAKRGEQLFTQAGCVACHTTKPGEPLKGPFLGSIASIYKRRDLAEAILEPNKSVAQGFAANRFELKDGEEVEGFVIVEEAERVIVRNIAAQEITVATGNIARREKLAKSLMPEGLAAALTAKDLASLLDYLEALPAEQAKP